MDKLIQTYAKKGRQSVSEIVQRYDQGSPENVGAYIKGVAAALGVAPGTLLNLSDPGTRSALIKAMIKHENGHVPYPDQMIYNSVAK